MGSRLWTKVGCIDVFSQRHRRWMPILKVRKSHFLYSECPLEEAYFEERKKRIHFH